MVTINGAVVLENFVTPISYTVNPDCLGTYTVPVVRRESGVEECGNTFGYTGTR